jgi:putative peptide zinc metalloprotease protein
MKMMRFPKVLLAVLLSFSIAASPAFADDGDNAAVAINTKDGSSVFRFAFDIHQTMNEVIDETNIAVAYASCEGCETVAIAIQIVLVSSQPDSIVPENVAISINEECISCETMASAYQFVIGEGGPIQLDKEGRKQIKEIRKAFYDLAKEVEKGDLTIPEIAARVTSLVDQIKAVLRDHVVPADTQDENGDGQGQEGQNGEEGDEGSSGGGGGEVESPQAGGSETPEPSVEPSVDTDSSPSPSSSEEPEASPSPEESPASSESPAPSPTATESP